MTSKMKGFVVAPTDDIQTPFLLSPHSDYSPLDELDVTGVGLRTLSLLALQPPAQRLALRTDWFFDRNSVFAIDFHNNQKGRASEYGFMSSVDDGAKPVPSFSYSPSHPHWTDPR
jgi:hypothetical protein